MKDYDTVVGSINQNDHENYEETNLYKSKPTQLHIILHTKVS